MDYVFLTAGKAISWCSQNQALVVPSRLEADCLSQSVVCREVFWLQRLLMALLNSCKGAVTIFSEGTSAIKPAGKGVPNRHNKHIYFTYHFVRDAVARNEIVLNHKTRSEMIADA